MCSFYEMKLTFVLDFYHESAIFRCRVDPSVTMYSLDDKRFAFCVQAFKFSNYAEVCLKVLSTEPPEIISSVTACWRRQNDLRIRVTLWV